MAGTALVSSKHKVFALPFDEALANLVPDHKMLQHPEKGELIVLPHKHEIVRLARNLDYRVPAPILTQYDWNGDVPFKTQKITAAMLTMNPRAYVLSEMGTGKTRAVLHALNYLLLEGEIERAIIAAPLSTLSQVWDKEVLMYFNHLSVGVLHGSREYRRKVLAEKHDLYVINHDGVETILPDLLDRDDIGAVVIDELASYRNKGTDRWKAMQALIQGRDYAWGLTGSPTPNEPVDAWGQCKLLTPHTVPRFEKHFRRMTMIQLSQFKWMAKQEANDIVYGCMQPAVRFTRDECVELPPMHRILREAKLGTEQARVYKQLIDKLTVAFGEGEVTAANEGVLFSKLLQISAGYVYTKDKQIVALDNEERLSQLEEVLDEAEGKVIVFAEFVHAAEAVYEKLKKDGYSAMLVHGGTAKSDRDHIFGMFQNSASPRVLVAHPKCMAHGLTLTAANVIVWFTPTTSLETYEQACARVSRPGQTRKQLIVHLTGSKVEAKLYRRLEQKKSLQGALLEMFENKEV